MGKNITCLNGIKSFIAKVMILGASFIFLVSTAGATLIGDTITANGTNFSSTATIGVGIEFLLNGPTLSFDFDESTLIVRNRAGNNSSWAFFRPIVFANFDVPITGLSILSNNGFRGSIVDDTSFTEHSIILGMGSSGATKDGSITFAITTGANSPPTVNSGSNISIGSIDQTITVIQGTASDDGFPDNDHLTYRWFEGETVLSEGQVGESGEAYLDLSTLPYLSLGQHTLTLEVSDGQATASDEMILTILGPGPVFSKSDIYVGSGKKNIIADLNNDGFKDIIANRVYLNNGQGDFTTNDSVKVNEFLSGNDVSDIDNDADLDFIYCHRYICSIYLNDGAGFFELDSEYNLAPGLMWDCRVADLNNDGFVDIVVNGQGYWWPADILWNKKDGTFEREETWPYGTSAGVDIGDFDNDGDFDILWSNNMGVQTIVANDSYGNFSAGPKFFWGYSDGSPLSTFTNLNSDGYLDAIIQNYRGYTSYTYLNNIDYTFTQIGDPFAGDYNSYRIYKSADIDNDGDDDVCPRYLNDGDGNLSATNETWPLWMALGDLNADGFLDVAHEDGYVYYNSLAATDNNNPPSVPQGLEAYVTESEIVFEWLPASDDVTPSPLLKYNLRVGSIPGGNDIMSGVTPGWHPNAEHNEFWTLHINLSEKCNDIYWSVQSQDGSYVRSDWAQEQFVKNIFCNIPPNSNAGPNITIESEEQYSTIIQGTANDEDKDVLNYRWLEGTTELTTWQMVGVDGEIYLDLSTLPFFSIGNHTLTLEVSDSEATTSDDMILTVGNSSPNVAPTGGGVYEIWSNITLGGQVSDFDGDTLKYEWLEGAESLFSGEQHTIYGGDPVFLTNNIISDLSLGTHVLTLNVTDGVNEPITKKINVEIVDTTVPTLAPVANKTILWPPNHKMVDILIEANASDNSGGALVLSASVMSNEPQADLDDQSSDWTEPEIDQENCTLALQLKSERSGSGDGRVYIITIFATDDSGNSSQADVNIIVPHDNRNSHL